MHEYFKVLFDTLLRCIIVALFCTVLAIVYFITKKDDKMATGGSETPANNATSDDLDESMPTQCAICREEYKNPRHLDPCLHIFCENCISRLADINDGYFDCPICRTEIFLPSEGVQGFAPSYIMNSVQDWFKTYRAKHKVSKANNKMCIHHPDESLRFQCQECNDLICPECLTNDHNGHRVKSLNKIIDDEKNQMKAKLKEKESNLGARKRKLEDKKSEVEKQRESELGKIHQAKKQAEELIEKATKIARAAAETEKKYLGEADKQLEDISRQLEENTQQIETVKNVQKRFQDLEVSNEPGEMTNLRRTLENVRDTGQVDVPQNIGHINVPNLDLVNQALDNIPDTFTMESIGPVKEEHLSVAVVEERNEEQMDVEPSPDVVQVPVAEQECRFPTEINVKEIELFNIETVVTVNNKKCVFQTFNGIEVRKLDKSLSSIDVRDGTLIAYSQKDKKMYSFIDDEFTIKDVPNIDKKNVSAITRGQDGVIYLASQALNKVYKCTDETREPQDFVKEMEILSFPAYICTSPDGNLVVSNSHANNVSMFDHRSKQVMWTYWGKDETDSEKLKQPKGVVCDAKGNVYVADHGNSRVTVINKEGNFFCHLIDHIPYPIDVCLRQNKFAVVHLNEGKKAFERHEVTIYNIRT